MYQKNLMILKQNVAIRKIFDMDKVEVLFIQNCPFNKNCFTRNTYRIDNFDVTY